MFKYMGMLLVSAFMISAVAPGFIHDAQAGDDRKGFYYRED